MLGVMVFMLCTVGAAARERGEPSRRMDVAVKSGVGAAAADDSVVITLGSCILVLINVDFRREGCCEGEDPPVVEDWIKMVLGIGA